VEVESGFGWWVEVVGGPRAVDGDLGGKGFTVNVGISMRPA